LYRKQGIGKAIMNMAILYAKNKKCYKVILESGIQRIDAHKFYESFGFNSTSKKGFELRLQ
jgi:GNAT superfamily N-acetyltransferase